MVAGAEDFSVPYSPTPFREREHPFEATGHLAGLWEGGPTGTSITNWVFKVAVAKVVAFLNSQFGPG